MKRNGFTVMMKLSGLVRPLAGHMILAVTMGLAGHLCASFITIFGGYAILHVLGMPAPFSIPVLFAGAVFFAALRAFLRYFEQNRNHFIAFTLLALIRDRVFASLRKLCPAKLEGRDRGDLINLITSDIELLEVFYAHTISPIVIAVLYGIIMICLTGSYAPVLGLLTFAAYVTIGVIVPVMISKSSGDTGSRIRTGAGDLASFVLESLRGLFEIRQFGTGEERLEEMMRKTEALSKDEEVLKRISGRNAGIVNALILIFDFAMLSLSVHLYQKGITGFEGVLIPTLALMSSFGPFNALAALGSTLQNTFASGNRVLDILEEEPLIEEISGKEKTSFGDTQVDDVSFSYEEEKILDHLSLEIPANTITGITGRSGSGKSTLLKLMMRFWKVNEGEIKIHGKSLEEINTSDLRNMESFVTQDTHLFHDSVRSNLLVAKPDATDEEIIDACRKASVHDFIMTLPQGYDTPVGELGDTLSGGERQRIGLARAFLHDADLMMLDEPTSNLDSLNEAVILKALREESKGKTVVLVSHRASTMAVADRVYSAENGRIS